MDQQSEAEFQDRTVDKWVKRARDGQIAVADFQRSFVWPPKKAARYINAILRGRPVGVYLILNSAESPQFSPRRFSDMDTPLDKVEELVLDGQQRLSSLLHALYGHPRGRFFVEVEEFRCGDARGEDCGFSTARAAPKRKDWRSRGGVSVQAHSH